MTRNFLLSASLVIGSVLFAPSPANSQTKYMVGAETVPPPKDSTLTIRVRLLAPGVFAAKVNLVWTGWVELPEGILLVDATRADSTAAALADTIAARSPGKKVRYLVLTNDNLDHMGGARRFLNDGAALIAYAGKMAEIDSVLGRTKSAEDIAISKKKRRLGDIKRPVDVMWLGVPGNSAGNLVVHLPREKVMFAGDLVWNRSVPSLLDRDMNLKGWNKSLDSLYSMRATIDSLVPGHGDLGPAVSSIRFTMGYLRDTEEKALQLVAARAKPETVKNKGYLGAYEGLEFYEETHFMNVRRLYNQARGLKTPGRIRVGTYRY
jgi:cyclase